jgi:hypothetical protein
VLTRKQFEAEKTGICASGPPSDGDNLLGMEIDCCAYLGERTYSDQAPDLWHDVTVSRSEGAEWLIAGTAVASPHQADAVAAELGRIWVEHLRYSYREAHTIVEQHDEVTLLAVTQIGPGELWVTAKVSVHLTDQ